MTRRSLRFRLVAAAAVAVLLAVIALGGAVVLVVQHELRASLDRTLRTRASDVARLAVSAPAVLTVPGALEAPAGGRELTVEVVDRRGRIVARSLSLGGRVLPGGALERDAIRHGTVGLASAGLGGEPIRLLAAPVADAGGPASGGAVLVASSTREIDDVLHRARALIAISALAAAALGALVAAALTRRGLAPLRALSAAARDIDRTRDASRRLPAPQAADEVAELATTLNGMLASLEAARDTERRFLADASHELRTPLTALRGNAAYIARHGADPEVLADLEADAARLGRMLDDLLALEREQGRPAPGEAVALDALVADVARREPRVDVGRSDPVRVAGDAGALERALDNLVANALVHGPEGGRVTVEVRSEGGRALLSVSDEGPGLSPEQAEHAFDRFWRGPDSAGRPGSGLGLAIVRATAERHGGTARVAGSRFELDLPAVRQSSRIAGKVSA